MKYHIPRHYIVRETSISSVKTLDTDDLFNLSSIFIIITSVHHCNVCIGYFQVYKDSKFQQVRRLASCSGLGSSNCLLQEVCQEPQTVLPHQWLFPPSWSGINLRWTSLKQRAMTVQNVTAYSPLLTTLSMCTFSCSACVMK